MGHGGPIALHRKHVALAHDLPAGSLVEADRGIPTVRPHQSGAGPSQPRCGFVEDGPTDALPLPLRFDRHPAQLPDTVVTRYERGDADDGVAVPGAEVERPCEVVVRETAMIGAAAQNTTAQVERVGRGDVDDDEGPAKHRRGFWRVARVPCVTPLPPVLLAHGFASSFEYNWRLPGFADLLGDAGRTVIPFDFPGHGNAPKPHDPDAYDDLAGALGQALPDGGQVDAVGFSLGATTLLRLASRVPDRFRKIVVAGVGENVFRDQDTEPVASAIESGAAPDGEVLSQLFVHFSEVPGNDPKALAACMRRMRDPMRPDEVARITGPVLVVLGDKDFAGPAGPLMDALPNARLVMLRNTEHFATPKSFAFWDAALDFLDASV